MITEFIKLTNAEIMGATTVEVKLKCTNIHGVATSLYDDKKVKVYYGNDDGSDDKMISAEEFNANWQVTSILFEEE